MTHCLISVALGRIHRGVLRKVEFQVEEAGQVVNWRVVGDPEELQELLSVRNGSHLSQAKIKPFGHSMGYELLRDQDRSTNMRDITDSTFPFIFGDIEIDFWVENLKNAPKKKN